MVDAIERGLQDLTHFEELGILNEGIGPDRISDLTCNVLKDRFIEYTEHIAQRHGLPTKTVQMGGARFDQTRMAWRSAPAQLPVNSANGRPILLVPRRFLRDLPVLNAYDWWENYEAEQLRNDVNYEVLGKVPKRTIVATARRHTREVRDWTKEKEHSPANGYDFGKDPLGVYQWLKAAQDFVQLQPLTLKPARGDTDFVGVIRAVIDKYRHFVEKEGGWRLLGNDNGSEKPEEAAQLLFKGVVQSYCEANNIVLDREVNLGRGPVDFKFSSGYQARAHLEVKKLHNGKFWNGLETQLPAYLDSDNCDLGWFVAIQYREGGSSKGWAKDGPRMVAKVAAENKLRLTSVTVDARCPWPCQSPRWWPGKVLAVVSR